VYEKKKPWKHLAIRNMKYVGSRSFNKVELNGLCISLGTVLFGCGQIKEGCHLLGCSAIYSVCEPMFGGTYRLHLQSRKSAEQETGLLAGGYVGFWWYVPPKRWFTYGLHGTISRKMTTFITTAVRTSDSKWGKQRTQFDGETWEIGWLNWPSNLFNICSF
jgi:hypothetical protein